MGKRKQDGSDMFAVLEHERSTAHFPAASDGPACVGFYASLIERYDDAMMTGNTNAALGAKAECRLFLDHVYAPLKDSRGICHNDVSRQFAKTFRAEDGQIPKWGQEGNFTITVVSVPVRIEIEHLCGLASYGNNLMPHFSIHIVEKHRLFLSHTGYRSFFPGLTRTEPGLSVAEAVGRILREYVHAELKGKLEKYDPYKGYSAEHRRDRMVADGLASGEAETHASRNEDAEPVEDEELACDGCSASLKLVDDFTENECGTFCGRCFLVHTRDCDACEIDLIKTHGGVHPSPMRSGSELLPDHQMAIIHAEVQPARVTEEDMREVPSETQMYLF